MLLDKLEPVTTLEIWEPKYSDKWEDGSEGVLLHADKVNHAKSPHLKIVFTKTKAEKFEGEWYISKKKAKSYDKVWNGSAWCYDVPFSHLEPLERTENSQFELY